MTAIRGPRLKPRRADAAVVGGVDRAELARFAVLELVGDLILVDDVVDQAGAARILGQEGSLVDQRAHLGVALFPPVGDAVDDLLVQFAIQPLVHRAVRWRVSLFGVLVRRGLEVPDVVNIRRHTDLVERAAKEHLVGGDAGEIERAGGHQEDLVGRAREVVLAVSAVFEVGVERLARLLEIDERVAQLLQLSPIGG